MARKWHGQKWIRNDKRLAIYMRDGLQCVYCGASLEDGAQFTLDHIMPHSDGGSNEATNLVTSCRACNVQRNITPFDEWCKIIDGFFYHPSLSCQQRVEASLIKDIKALRKVAKQVLKNRMFSKAVKAISDGKVEVQI